MHFVCNTWDTEPRSAIFHIFTLYLNEDTILLFISTKKCNFEFQKVTVTNADGSLFELFLHFFLYLSFSCYWSNSCDFYSYTSSAFNLQNNWFLGYLKLLSNSQYGFNEDFQYNCFFLTLEIAMLTNRYPYLNTNELKNLTLIYVYNFLKR